MMHGPINIRIRSVFVVSFIACNFLLFYKYFDVVRYVKQCDPLYTTAKLRRMKWVRYTE